MKKNNIFIFLISVSFLVSCTVEPPSFIVKGVRLKSALSFLEEFQKEEKEAENKEAFSHYVDHLRDKHAPSFSWSEYWSGIKEKNLYKNLKEEELNKLLSLSEVSCKQEDMNAFTSLLLQIAESDSKKLLFSHQLSRLSTVCSTWLSHFAFKSIVQFLVNKREELETEKIKQEKSQVFLSASINPALALSPSPVKPYIYTKELQKTLVGEWSRTQNVRVWTDILNVVDRAFWSDARWINYQKKNHEYLKRTLEMEWSTYQSIKNLDQDIFLMFKEKDKMSDIMSLSEYKRYFATFGSLNWSLTWEKFLLQYPKKPNTDNTKTLLSLYSFSCQDQDLRSYFNLVDHWDEPDYKSLAIKFCVEVMRIKEVPLKLDADLEEDTPLNQKTEQGTDDESVDLVVEDKINNTSLGLSSAQILEDNIPNFTYEILENTLKDSSKPKSLQFVSALLFVYEKEKYKRSSDEWKQLISYFSETDWLNLMDALRNRHDRKSISEVLHIHNQAYEGHVPFLLKDIWSVFIKGEHSVLEIADEYGYNRAYVDNPDFRKLFWAEITAVSAQEVVSAQEQVSSNNIESLSEKLGTQKCDLSYIRSLFQFFNNSNRRDLLFEQFNFENCLSFVEDFRQREWNKIVNQVSEKDWTSWSESLLLSPPNPLSLPSPLIPPIPPSELNQANQINYEKYQFIWWLADILSLYPHSLDTVNISRIEKQKWEDIILILILSFSHLKEANFRDENLFYDTAYRVNNIYQGVSDSAVCRFFGYKESHFFIQEYSVDMITHLLTLYPPKPKSTYNRNRQNIKRAGTCNNLIPRERMNTFLFILAHFTLSSIELKEEDNLEQLWQNVDSLIHLFKEINLFQLSSYQSSGLWRYLRNVPKYNNEKGYMSSDSLGFYFMSLIFRKIKALWPESARGEVILPLENEFNKVYRSLIEQAFLPGSETNWEEELLLLEEKLLLPSKVKPPASSARVN